MNNRLLFIIALIISSISFAQNDQPVNCDLAIPGCDEPQFPIVGVNPTYNYDDFGTGTISNPSTNPNPGNDGCLLSGETVSTFIVINIVSDGTLEWSMQGNGGTGFFDWIMWPYEYPVGSNPSNTCQMLQDATIAPVSCNWNWASDGFTGMAAAGNIPVGGDPGNFELALNVTAGEAYLLCLSNYSGTDQDVALNFYGSADVSCNPATPDQTICEGSSATVDVFAPGIDNPTYNWLVTDGVADPTSGVGVQVTPTQTTEYHVEITGDNISKVDTFTIYVVPPPTPDAGTDDLICLGDQINLNGTNSDPTNNTISWTHNVSGVPVAPTVNYSPSTTISNPSVTVNQVGTYLFILNETNDICGTISDTVEIIVSDTEHTTSFTSPSCAGMFDGTITINNVDAVSFSFDGGTTWQPENTKGGLPAGDFSVCSQNQYGCTYCSDVSITEPPAIIISAVNDTLICQNGTANLWASISEPVSVDYHWSHTTSTLSYVTASPLINTTYEVYASNADGCHSDTAFIDVNVRPVLSGTPTANTIICPGYPVVIGVSGITGGMGAPYMIDWNSGESAEGTSMEITANPTSTFVYTVTISDVCETTPVSYEIEVAVAPVPEPIMAAIDSSLCEPAQFELLNLTDPTMVQDYVWIINEDEVIINQDPSITENLYYGNYDVQLIVTSPDGCIDSVTNENFLTVYPQPDANFQWSPNPVLMFNTEVDFMETSTHDYLYEWTFYNGNPSYSNDSDPTSVFPDGVVGQYPVTLVVTSEYNCVDSVTKIVSVLPEVLLFAPNAFTPDGDEFNQSWNVSIEGIDVYDYNLKIFNRWGEVVWESKDPEASWDGTYNGMKVKADSYIWTIETRDRINDGKYEFNGVVTILR